MELTKFYNFQDHCSRNWTNTVWLLSCRSSLRNFTRGTFTRFSLVKHSAWQRFQPVKLSSKRHLTLFCTEKPSVMLHEQNFSVKVYDSLFLGRSHHSIWSVANQIFRFLSNFTQLRQDRFFNKTKTKKSETKLKQKKFFFFIFFQLEDVSSRREIKSWESHFVGNMIIKKSC